jgi:hypothetical protein
MQAKYNGKCNHCLKQTVRGTNIFYDPDNKAVFHPACKDNPYVEVVRAGAMWSSADAGVWNTRPGRLQHPRARIYRGKPR